MNLFKGLRTFQIDLEFGSVGFWGVRGEKPLGARERNNNKLIPHMASTAGFEHGPRSGSPDFRLQEKDPKRVFVTWKLNELNKYTAYRFWAFVDFTLETFLRIQQRKLTFEKKKICNVGGTLKILSWICCQLYVALNICILVACMLWTSGLSCTHCVPKSSYNFWDPSAIHFWVTRDGIAGPQWWPHLLVRSLVSKTLNCVLYREWQGYLTVIPRARMGSESAEWAIHSEAMTATGIIVLVKSN